MSNQVVVAYDFSEHAEIALDTGIELACRDPNHCLHILTVLDDSQDYLTADEVRHQLLRRFRTRVDARSPAGAIELFVHTRIGDPVAEIVGLAEDVGADLVIVGSHGRSRVGRLLLGSVSQGVLHGAHCPVLVARQKSYANVQRDTVVEVPPHRLRTNPPHRYSYTTGAELLTRPEWPL